MKYFSISTKLLMLALLWAPWGVAATQEPHAPPPTEKPATEASPLPEALEQAAEQATQEPPPSTYDKERTGEPPEEPQTLAGQALRIIISLVIVVGLIYLVGKVGLSRLVKLRGPGGEHLKTVERLQLDPKSALYLVTVGNKPYLVGTGEHGVSRIQPLDESALNPAAVRKDFSSALDTKTVSEEADSNQAPRDGKKNVG